jgi:hypothetical protein
MARVVVLQVPINSARVPIRSHYSVNPELTKPDFPHPPLPPHQNVERAASTSTYTVILPVIHVLPAQST